MKLDRDRLNHAAPADVAEAAMAVIDALQTRRPEAQAAGAAVAFLAVCEHFRVEPQDVMVVTKNILAARKDSTAEFRAVVAYVTEELGDQR